MADITLSRAIEDQVAKGHRVSFHPVTMQAMQIRLDGSAGGRRGIIDTSRDDQDFERRCRGLEPAVGCRSGGRAVSAIAEAYIRDAHISHDGKYRYSLLRQWKPEGQLLHVVGLNPSTADATRDDPTVRRIAGLVKAAGYPGFILTNLFAYRATSPADMRAALDPVGPLNDCRIQDFSRAYRTVVAWGTHGAFRNRGAEVIDLLLAERAQLRCWGTTADGHPRHPLYLRGDTPLVVFS